MERTFRFAVEQDTPVILNFIKELASIAVERGCGRLERWCLDWNKPSIDFYKIMGAEPMEDWTVYRVAGETLDKLAEEAAI